VPVIFDTDLGTDVDDAWALLLAATSPRIDLRAVTVYRRKSDVRARLARKLLNDIGRLAVPVGRGAETTLSGGSTYFGGWEGKGYLTPDEPLDGVIDDNAASLIVKTLEQSDRPVTIVTVGGVTNLALAFQQSPACTRKVARLVIMGGSVHPIRIGDKELPAKWESNLVSDIDAAKFVLEIGLPTTLVPAEVTFHAKLYKDDYAAVQALNTPLAAGMVAMTDLWAKAIEGFARRQHIEAYYADTVVLLHDPLAVYTLIEPDLIESKSVRIRVETEEREIRTIADPNGPIQIELVTGANMHRLSKACVDTILNARSDTGR
jgi:inosine-uridine nucleoside N-ribohydrolase